MGIVHSLYVGFGVLMSLMVAMTAFTLIKVAVIDSTLSHINDNVALKQRSAIDFRGAVHDSAIAIRDAVIAPNEEYRNKQYQILEKLIQDYDRASTRMDKLFEAKELVSSEDTRLYDNIKAIATKARALKLQTMDLLKQGNIQGARALLVEQTADAYTVWLKEINRFIDYQESISQNEVTEVRKSTSSLLLIMIIAAIVSLSVGLAIGYRVIAKLKATVGGSPEQAVINIKRFAQGDLTIREATTYKNSIVSSINTMADHLSSIIKNISDLTSDLTSSSAKLSNLAGDNSNLTSLQKAETQKGADGIANIIAGIDNVASQAGHAVSISDNANTETQNGDEEVKKTIEYINNLAMQVDQVSDVIQRLDADSKEISQVTQIIAEIAEQTNLLALNAAIEAARAGEHGRGFAVVADEVRALAGRTKESTNGIINLIKSNQEHTKRAVEAMAQSKEQASLSVEQAQKAGDSLAAIRESVAQINAMNVNIASAAHDQTSILQEVNANFTQITEMAEKTLEASNDMASLSAGLSSQATNLEQIVNSFKIK